MLHQFLTSNRQLIIQRCRDKSSKRLECTEVPGAIDHGVPLFLQQLVDTLRTEQTTHIRAADTKPTPAPTEIGRSAALYGAELLRRGLSVDQVVHNYGDVCQSVTAIAVEQHEQISTDEFRTLNRCLDDAIADAVTAYGAARQVSIDRQAESSQQRSVDFASEHRRLVDIAIQSLAALKTGNIGIGGATGTLLAHALDELRSLPDRTAPESRLATAEVKAVAV
jgi:hypothetical protein